MTTKFELTAHMANLSFIMDHHERLGTTKNKFVVADFQSCHDELTKLLEKEDEARKRNNDKLGAETRADKPSGQPGLRGSAGESRRHGPGG